MKISQSKTDHQDNFKTSLRGEAPQVHGVKGEKSKKSELARGELITKSQEAKARIEIKAATTGEVLSVNEMLVIMYRQESGCLVFKTFHDWKKDGYSVKKGECAFRIWAKPIKAKAAEDTIIGDEEAHQYKFWPMCCLFNESQVERNGEDGDDKPKDTKPQNPEETPKTTVTNNNSHSVNVASFRDAIAHLERVFHCDRHACVGDKEKTQWRTIATRVMAQLKGTHCTRAKPKDIERLNTIITKVTEHLAENPAPLPPKPNTSEPRYCVVDDDSKIEAGGLTLPEAENLLSRFQNEDGDYYLTEEKKTPDTNTTSPFVMQNYAERQEARKDRMEEYAERAHTESQATYQRATDMASVIPFGQPILVGHHSEHRDRHYRDRIHNTYGKAFALDDKAQHYERKAAAVGYSGIASNDPDAIDKLQQKLAELEASQDRMKAANRAIKKNDDAALQALGFSDAQVTALKDPEISGWRGFPPYSLSNNGAEIRRTKKRIAELEWLRTSTPIAFENTEFSMCISNGRVVIEFPAGKPADDVRTLLKRSAFKWSRYQVAWVRKATANAVTDATRLLEQLKIVESIY